MTDLPFDGDISRYFNEDAPSEVRAEIKGAKKGEILATDFPYDKKWKRSEYEESLAALQVELVKMHQFGILCSLEPTGFTVQITTFQMHSTGMETM